MAENPIDREANPGARHAWSPTELKAIIEAEKNGPPFIVFRTSAGQQVLLELDSGEGLGQLTIGRSADCEVDLSGDPEASRTHCMMERIGAEWTVEDDGLSRNGSFVNGARIQGRVRLHDKDVIRCGQTMILFREPGAELGTVTSIASSSADADRVTDAQRKVLVALVRPFLAPGDFVSPASNKEIAEELFLSLDTVKTHLRALFQAFGLDDVPQNQKRLKLVEAAINSGLVSANNTRD